MKFWNKQKHNDHIVASFAPQGLSLSIVRHVPSKIDLPSFKLLAFQEISFSHHEYDQGNIFNPSSIARAITHFLATHKKQSTPIVFIIDGNHIDQKIVSCVSASPSKDTFKVDEKLHSFNYLYVYPEASGTFSFYTCSIPHTILMQYKLLAIANKLNLQAISTRTMAHFSLYRLLQGSTYSQTALGMLLENNNNNTRALINDQTIQNMLHIDSPLLAKAIPLDQLRIVFGSSTLIPV